MRNKTNVLNKMDFKILILMIWIASVRSGRRLLGYEFRRENPIGQKQCLKLCLVHTDCLSINFSRHQLLCELNSQSETADVKVTENTSETEGFIYISKNTFPQEIISVAGSCGNVPCSLGQRCFSSTTGGITCTALRCLGDPQPVRYGYSASLPGDLHSNGSFSSESNVGERRHYTCANGTIPVGGNQVTCLANGQWEKPLFICQVCTKASDPKGEQYWGTVNVTVNGKTCQRWDTTSPHSHSFLTLEENFCRNPDQTSRPWCYTLDPSVRWELCDIPVCT